MNNLFKAVIFDIGGVVLRSPFLGIDAYEREHGLPSQYINVSMCVCSSTVSATETDRDVPSSTARGSQGAWQRFERGELGLIEFYEAFGRDLSDSENGNKWYRAYCQRKGLECPKLPDALRVDGRELFGRMMHQAYLYDPHILKAIHRLRATGRYRIIALTNNFAKVEAPPSELEYLGWQNGATPPTLRALFDDFCDSSELGSRKPEHRFYMLACERNGIQPREAIFLDDIKMNLKAAQQLGMETIHVPIGGTLDAVKRLEVLLGLDLTSDVVVKL